MKMLSSAKYVRVPTHEYDHLKILQKKFEQFLGYFEYVKDIRESREEARNGKTISQEELFKKLGI